MGKHWFSHSKHPYASCVIFNHTFTISLKSVDPQYIQPCFNHKRNVLITGASRGIGKAIALKLAAEGANIAIAAKTIEAHPRLEGTIHSAAEEIRQAGTAKFSLCQTDIRKEADIAGLIDKTVEAFGGIDILINNASAIDLVVHRNNTIKEDMI